MTDDVEPAPTPSAEDLAALHALVERYRRLESWIAARDADLARARLNFKTLRETEMPLAMMSAGVETLPLTDGSTLRLSEFVSAGITEISAPLAHAWLEENAHADMLRHVITLTFNKGEDRAYRRFVRDLGRRKHQLQYAIKTGVAANTLVAFARRVIEKARRAGLDPRTQMPYELLGVYHLRYAEIVKGDKDGIS